MQAPHLLIRKIAVDAAILPEKRLWAPVLVYVSSASLGRHADRTHLPRQNKDKLMTRIREHIIAWLFQPVVRSSIQLFVALTLLAVGTAVAYIFLIFWSVLAATV